MTWPAGPPAGFPHCAVCPYLRPGPVWVCTACASVAMPPPAGGRCGVCVQQLESSGQCGNIICSWTPAQRGFTRSHAITVFSGHADQILRNYKYGVNGQHANGWAHIFARLVLGWLGQHTPYARSFDLIIGNPTWTGRQPVQHIELILALAIAEDTLRQWPLRTAALTKPSQTPASAGSNWAGKQAAADAHAAAISINEPVAGRRILLFDDVFTTGLQLAAVSRRLLAAGALQVDTLVIARTPWKPRI